jgi:parallel beta-helix repeat protein
MHSRAIVTIFVALVLISPLNFGIFNSSAIPAAVISTVSGANTNERFGWNVSDCGDVNGDGFEDIIVGAPGYNSDQGRAYIFFGGPSFTGNLIAENADVILNGSYPGAQFGWDVSGAGDFNGDGINDTIVGAPKNNTEIGAANIFFGSASLGGEILSENANISINGENSGDNFGSSVSDLGDVSKENPVNHVVISEVYANAVDETSPNIGEYMELYNPTSSPVVLDNWVIEDMDSHSFTLAGTIPAYGFFLIAIDNYPMSTDPTEASWPPPDFDCGYTSGSVFANSGDEIRLKDDTGTIIDTFGYGSSAEWYEGAYHPVMPNPWESYERKLGETVPNGGNAIDTDDNANDFAVRSAAEPQNSASAPETPPPQSVYKDVIVGAPGYGNYKGRAYVFSGSSGGTDSAGNADLVLTGKSDFDVFGFSVSGAGDVNSDTFDDIIVGAPGYDSGRGRSYIYYGAQDMKAWTQDIVFASWAESDGAVYDDLNVYAIYEKRWLGQSFTPNQDILLTKLWLYLDNRGDTIITITLEGHNNGPDDNILATATPKASNPASPMSLTWVEFEFPTPYQLSAGTMYWITARATGKNTNNCWGWLQDLDSNPNYPGGYSSYIINPPGPWTEEPDYDYWFKALGRLPSELKPDVTLTGGAQGDLFGTSVSDLMDIGGDGYDDVIIGTPGTANGNAYLINGSIAMKDVTVSGIGLGDEIQFSNWETGGDMEPAVYSGQFVAQSFIPQQTHLSTNVSLLIKTFGTQGTLTIKLMGSTGSSPDTVPDGIVLAQAPSISTGNVSYEWTDFEWIVPYSCTAGTEYFIVAEGTGADTANCWGWYAQRTGNFPDGDSAFDPGGGWTAYDADFYFRARGREDTVLPNITFQGESPGDMFGYSVSGAGNFNGDSNDDIVIGAPYSGNGKIYIFNGSGSIPPTISGAFANYTVLGEGVGDRFGWSVSTAMNVNTSVGNFEVIVGAPYQDPGGVGDAGRAYIISQDAVPPPPPPIDLPFRINNDAEFAALAASEGWVGDGSAGNPYIIEDYDIDGGGYGYCIYIGNTTVSFIIRNSTFSNSSGNAGNYFWNSGVALFNAPNGTLSGNTFENITGDSIYLDGATNITITQNTILNTTSSGIYMESSTGNFIDNNTFDNNNYGIEMNSNSNSNFITNNTFTNNSEALDLWACDSNIIADNIGYDNSMFAYLFGGCNGNEFLNNTITDSGTGIYLQSNCDGNTIQNNTIFNLTQEGIVIESSDSNIIDSNDIQNCREGIYTILAFFNIISNNTLSNNSNNGIYFDPGSDQNTVYNNTIAFNGDFGILMISADLNFIIYNDIFNNTLYGVNVSSTTNDNEIHHNTFDDNNGGDVQAYDDGSGNIWDDGTGEGNLWGDYEDRYVPPASSDGKVWDIPYDINGSAGAQDLYPLALYPWYQDLRINNNSEFADTAAFFGWAGDGSAGNPYVIEGLTIDAGGLGYGIYIGNTTANFIIRNCSIENSTGNSNQYFRNSGIYLYNATNGTIENNDIKSCDGNGINIEYSLDIVVTDNTVRYNEMSGIYTGYYSNITISDNTASFNNWSGVWLWSTWESLVINNTCSNNTDGITLEWTDNISIIDNTCANNTDDGIYVTSSEYNTLLNNTCANNEDGIFLSQSNNITVSGNDCNNNTDDGITLVSSNDVSIDNNSCTDNANDGIYLSASDYNTIINNVFENNSDDGIALSVSDYNTITNNTSNNNQDGIWLGNSHNNTIDGNTCENNSDGIDLDLSNNNALFNNTCVYNSQSGIDLNQSSNNTFVSNECNNNTNNGIELSYYCNDTIIRNNTISGNIDDGISIDIGNSNGLIENNTISENGGNGIYLIINSDGFIIIYNVIANNTDYGIEIRDNDCENNLIHHNGFFFNNGTGVQAYDNGSNMWDDGYPSGGNFWSDYIGVDFNSTATQDVPPPDGIGDTPYDTVGPKGAQDRYPLITFPWSLPPPVGLPEISNVLATPDPQETGGFVNISCNVTDSDEVKEVWVNITLPSGGTINVSMTNGSGGLWYDDSVYSILGLYDYVIWAKDGAGVWNSSSGHTFTIHDTTAPFIFNVQNLPSPQELGGSTNITCDVTDNVGVYGMWLNVSYPTGGFTNVSMIKGAGDQWFYESVYLTLGGYSYMIWANDTSNNWDVSMNNNFQIQDTTAPVISSVIETPDPQLPGDFVNITCDVIDNLAVYGVWVNITLPGGGSTNVSMNKGAVDEWFLDSMYISLGIYNYEIWANDTQDNWATSSGHSFLIDDPNPPVISNILDGPDPQIPGGFVNITCDVIDDMGVFGVWVNITLPSGGFTNISMNKGVADAWFFNSSYLVSGIYDYVIWANDTSNNWVNSAGFQFEIGDSSLPVISNVLDIPDPQIPGGFVNISCDVIDNVDVYGVWVNITLPSGGYNNISMNKGVGDAWFLESPYITSGLYDYVIWANDTSNNWAGSFGHQFEIGDSILPVISNVLDTPDPQEVNGAVNISCDVIDNVGVYGVWVNITLPGGGYNNISMNKGVADAWFLESSYFTLGLYDYVIWANDTSDNWVSSTGYQFTIQDTTLPVISNELDIPDPQEVGSATNISCDVTDNVDVYGVWVNITLPGGGYCNISMMKGPGDTWYLDSTHPTLGLHNYVIWANDTSDNWATSSGHSFLIQDTTIPVISNVVDAPDPQETGGFVNVSCDVSDNVKVYNVWINITLPGGGFTNISMDKGMVDQWFLDTSYINLGVYDYIIWVNDTQNNWASSNGYQFTIQDSIPPEISNVVAVPDPQIINGIVNLSCDVQDDFGISQVWINITGPDMSFLNISMEKGSGSCWFNDSIYTILGSYDFVVWARDNSGNWNSSSGHSFDIQTGPAYNIILISGHGQSDFVGSQLTMPFIVEVQDQFGNSVPNADVWFNITSGGGGLSVLSPISTDANGRAQTYLTLGILSGTNSVTSEIAGGGISQVIFAAIGLAGAPHDIVVVSGNGQSTEVDTQLPAPFIVEVRDQFGNSVPNAEVWFNVTVGSGYLDSSSLQITDAMGRAQVNLTLGTQTGLNTVTSEIASSGVNQVTFNANGLSGTAYNIIIISGNGQTDVVGEQLQEAFVVEVTDQFGNKVTGSEVWFNVTSGNGLLEGSSPVLTDSNGTVSVTFTLGPEPGSNSVSSEIAGKGTNSVIFLATGTSNEPEIISKIESIEMQEDDPPYSMFLFASAIDDDDMPSDLKWYITDFDSSLYSVSGQGTNILVITPEPDMFGIDAVTLIVVDTDGLSDSQPFWINITPVNDKPFFFPEPPDLTVTKDLPYTFNYAPYLIDIDNTMAELMITTDSSSYTAVSGHLITYLYPETMVNQQQFVTLTLDDGTDSTQTVIQVNVTEDSVPVLNKELPDVTLYEGEIKYNVFNLDDYFYDPDGDSVFFSYGYSRINIIIHENHSVDFYAEGDWNGEEVVTFRARDPNSAIVEDTISVKVIPVNDPPSISGAPDLVVHYDYDYIFDLTPYIFDADNSTSELELSFMESSGSNWLVSQNINVSSENNLRMVVNYSQIHLGTTFKVRIIVFDGIDFASQVINITVSENWQPELEEKIPDVVFYEDEYVSNEFNLNDYFSDKDNDALFFTYGQKHIKIMIHQNGSVDFYSDENWYGTENITIRATDPSGAIVEDIITVSVLPVNDPPRISNIPDQEGFVGVTWVLDISSYVHDDDNNLTELEIYTESPYVTVVGTVLVFQYPNDVREDSVYLLVLDPTNSNADTTFNVTIKETPKIGSGSSDILPFIWLFILIIIIMVTLLLLYVYTRGKYVVEEALLVYRNKGILIAHVNEGMEEKMDRDLMTGMFTAIQDFVGDVFESEGQDTTQLKEMELGNKKVLIEHGQYTYIAAVFKGGAARLAPKLKSTLAELETEFIELLEDWDGEIEAFDGVEVYLENLMKT